jgi:hypothetical protein
MILEKEKQLHVSALRPSSGWILGLKEKYFIASPCWLFIVYAAARMKI